MRVGCFVVITVRYKSVSICYSNKSQVTADDSKKVTQIEEIPLHITYQSRMISEQSS